MQKYLIKIIIIFFFFLANSLYAQTEKYSIKRLSLEDGLSQSTVYSITQDKQGFMWFTTEDGLNRYDGYNFTVYKNNSFDKNSLSENSIYSIDEGEQGVLWIATWSTGLNRFDVKKNQFTRFINVPEDSLSLSSNNIYALSVDNDGYVWIATDDGLNRLDTTTQTFKHFHHDPQNDNSIISNFIQNLVIDNDGKIWAGSEYGLSMYDPEKNVFINFKNDPLNPASLINNNITSLAVSKTNPNTVWAGTANGGIEKINTKKGSIEHFGYGYIPGIPQNNVLAIETDYNGKIWIGSNENGLIALDPQKKQIEKFIYNPSDLNSIAQNSIYSLYVGQSGIIWAGTGSSGINVINQKVKNFKWYRENDTQSRVISTNVLAGLLEDKRQNLWICGWNSGLTILNKERNKSRIIKKNTFENRGLNSNSVLSAFELRDGRICIATGDGGINIYNHETNRFQYVKNIPGNTNSLAENYVMMGLEDKNGDIWLGLNSMGLDKWDIKEGRFTHYRNNKKDSASLAGNDIYTLFEDDQGKLWVSSQREGISILNKKTNRFSRFVHDENNRLSLGSNDVMVFLQASDKTMWLGTFGAGLNKFNAKEKTFKSYKEEDGLPNNVVYGILEDDNGFLWLSTNKGISRFNPRTEEFRNYDVSDGLQSNEFNSSYYKTSDGEMFFGGINGLNSFFPDEIKDNTFIPPVYITNMQILNKNISANQEFNGRKVLIQSISYTNQIELTYDDYLVSFEFAALNYINSHKNKYAYKLVGFDKDWNLSDNQRFATYRNLPPDEYMFRVKGSNNDNIWNDNGVALRIIVIPVFWQTWWFRSFILVLITFALIYYNKSRTRTIKIQNIKLEKAVKEKTSEMKNLMDKMIRQEKLATIGKVSGSIAHELRNPLGAVRQSVYFLRTKFSKVSDKMNKHLELIDSELSIADRVINDLLEMTRLKKLNKEYTDLKILINQSIQRCNLNGKINVKINISPQDQFIWVDQVQFGQVFVNLITNSFQAMEGTGTLVFNAYNTVDNKFLQIEIEDNGCGINRDELEKIFEPLYTSKAKGTGLGLSICKQIVEKHGGEIKINSEVNKGTHISILLPYKGA